MEHTTKMFLVPKEMFSKVNKDTFSSMDQEMHEILYNDQSSDRDKWKAYSNILQKYLHAVGESEKPLEIPLITKDSTSMLSPSLTMPVGATYDFLLDTINAELSAKYRDKAKSLYNILKTSGHIEWNNEGEIAVNGIKIADSNIIALIKAAVKPKTMPIKPVGWDKFTEAIISSNVPKEAYSTNIERNILALHNRNLLALEPIELIPTPLVNKLRPTKTRRQRVGPYSGPWAQMKI
jgi:hypothetical protein